MPIIDLIELRKKISVGDEIKFVIETVDVRTHDIRWRVTEIEYRSEGGRNNSRFWATPISIPPTITEDIHELMGNEFNSVWVATKIENGCYNVKAFADEVTEWQRNLYDDWYERIWLNFE
jgi:ASC-1-like (ASCH) protein